MKFIWIFIIILVPVMSSYVGAKPPIKIQPEKIEFTEEQKESMHFQPNPLVASPDYPEPQNVVVDTAKDYYKKAYGYNTKDACTGKMCIPPGSTVGCTYSYKSGGAKGSQVQICTIQNIRKEDGTETDVSDKNFMMVTGLINANNEFTTEFPDNEILLVKYSSMSGKWKQKKFEPSPILALKDMTDPNKEGVVCVEGGDCKVITDPCKLPGQAAKLDCLARAIKDYALPDAVFGAPETVDRTFSHKRIADAFKIGNSSTSFAPSCLNFIDKTGHLGVRGKKVLAAIEKVGKSAGGGCFSDGDPSINVSDMCPNFNKFTKKQIEYFWVWAFASLANDESTCGVKLTNSRAKNGVAHGLLQMEGVKWRKKNGRNKQFCPHYNINDKDETFQFECSASIMVDTVCKGNRRLNNGSGYWAQLRNNGSVTRHIRQFPGCN